MKSFGIRLARGGAGVALLGLAISGCAVVAAADTAASVAVSAAGTVAGVAVNTAGVVANTAVSTAGAVVRSVP